MATLKLNAPLQISAGRPWPLGAHWDGKGVNFALFSAHATAVELCLFIDAETANATDAAHELCIPLTQCTDQIWHAYLPDAAPGLCYAYRVHGPQTPGHRFDSNRLLLDPYARELTGVFSYDHQIDHSHSLKACVVDDAFDWGDEQPPNIPLKESVLYETHVKGATRQHPELPTSLRGTYAGLASPAMISHYQRLGITALNLLPVHCFLDEERLIHSGRSNYWGYNSLAFFIPEHRYAAHQNRQTVRDEFRSMVRQLHAAKIEVILDVVFNHTAETDEHGPTISFRGIDNQSYYRIPADDPTRYENFSGCGNTLNLAHPRVLQLVMDALRYWVDVMHVDGFRFDLAAALTRDSGFLNAIRQDPTLSRVKLIAEPWDLGPDGYRLGRFLPGWSEWNDRFRDDVRAFWLTGECGLAGLAQRLAGSSEIFQHDGRSPLAGVNFISAHDGFTLRDLVSYQHKHNELNGENNRDGHGHNLSWHCGEEGDSTDPLVLERRRKLQRALLTTLFIAQGVPMLQGGDELGRTQAGNNNAYCQDNSLTWFNWAQADQSLIDFTAELIALRKRFPQLRRRTWLTGMPDQNGQRDIIWHHPSGHEMQAADWHNAAQNALGLSLAPEAAADAHVQDTLLILINRADTHCEFALPHGEWMSLCDSAAPSLVADTDTQNATSEKTMIAERSIRLFVQR